MQAHDYETLTLLHIQPKYRRGESDLYGSKWWDYRPLHPMAATYRFAEAYKTAFKRSLMRRYDLYVGLNHKGLKHEDFTKCSRAVVTGMWLARRMADRIGCPYEFYCNMAFQYVERRDWKFLPTPQQLYVETPMFDWDISMVEFVRQNWEQTLRDRVMYATDDFYCVERFTGNRHQLEHQSYLLNRTLHHPHRALLIYTLVYEKRLLFEQAVEASPDGKRILAYARKFAHDAHL